MADDIAKAWAGIGSIKASAAGLERKITTYRHTRRNEDQLPTRSVFENMDLTQNRNLAADTIPRVIVESRYNQSANQRTSSPLKSGRTDVVFSDIESVSTIPSRPLRDPKSIEDGMIKLKEKILRQKQLSAQSVVRREASRVDEQQVRFLDPEEYSLTTSHNTRAPQVAPKSIVRKRKKATAPTLDNNIGCNEPQKPVKKPPQPVQLKPKSPEPKPVTRQPVQRKVKAGDSGKSAIITTSSWRQGAALTRKVLGNKTEENTSSTSITSETTSTKSSKVAKKENLSFKKPTRKAKTPPKAPKKPKKIEKPPLEEPPKIKARHYNPSDVQNYIENTRKLRKEQMVAEKRKQIAAEKEKEKRLKELYDFQKKALKRSTANPSPTSPPPETRKKTSVDFEPKSRATSSESSDKENITISEKSVPNIPLLPTSSGLSEANRQSTPCKKDEINLCNEKDEDGVLSDEEKENSVKDINLLDTYMDPGQHESYSSTTALYNEQRQRMDAIRQTALALRQKIYEETNRLTAEASRATNFTAGLPRFNSQHSLPGAKNIREAWTESSPKNSSYGKTEDSVSEDVSKASSIDYRDYQIPSPPKREVTPEPYQYPLTADPYSIINVYARKRQLEEKRIEEEKKKREETEEKEREEREAAVLAMQKEREQEQEKLRELERQLLEDKEAIADLEEERRTYSRPDSRSRFTEHVTEHVTEVDMSDVSVSSAAGADTRNTESLLRTSSSDSSSSTTRDKSRDSYHFTPDKTEDISLVSPASAKKTLSFSEDPTPVKHSKSDEDGVYSPGALHRKLRSELARYDTFSAGLEHANTLEHTHQHTEAQHDTIAMARAMQREKSEHATEMSELQEKLKKDMLAFQEKLQHVQQQTMLTKAENLAKEAEIKAKSAKAALQATHQIAASQEETNKELINMAQHILKSHTKKSDSTPIDSTSRDTRSGSPYTPSQNTPKLSQSALDEFNDITGSEALSPTDTTINITSEVESEPRTPSPTKSRPVHSDIPEEFSEQIATSSQHDIPTEMSADPETSPISEDPVTPVTEEGALREEPVTPDIRRGVAVDDTPGREADVETEFETSPEKVHESFRAVLPSESHRRRMSASDAESVVSVNISARKDKFATFTLEQVSQYMKNEKLRSKHQKALLALRQQAVKEKTDAKLQWIDIKKRRIQKKGYDERMPPLIQQEKDILATLASEQEEIRRLAAVQRAAQAERKKMLLQQREISHIQERTAALRRKIKYAEENPTDFEEVVSDTDVSEYTRIFSEYDTDASSVYEADGMKIQSLTDFNLKIQKEGEEVRKLLDLALSEKKETEKIEQEFGISSPSRLPRGITPLNDTSSTLKDDLNNTLKYTEVDSSTPVKDQIGDVPDSPALSVIDPDQSSLEVKEMEERILSLKNELKRKKDEARKLLKDQQQKKKEALRQQELKLRKQIQTVTDVIEKQKKQISTKLRQHSPSRSDRGDSPTKRTLIRSHSSRSDVSISPDSSRIISITSSFSDKTVSERQDDESISESVEKSTRSVSESVEKKTAATSQSVSSVSRKRDDTSNSISEDLSKFSEASYHKLIPSTVEIDAVVHLSLPELAAHDSSEPAKPGMSNSELADEDHAETDRPSIFSLQEIGDIAGEDKAPYSESPQPSFHLDVKEVLEDLSISSGSSINDNTDVSISSYKNLTSHKFTRPKDDDISEEISEALPSDNSSDKSRSLSQTDSNKSAKSSSSSSYHKTISEKLAELNLDSGVLSPTLNKLTSKSSVKHSYTLSFDEAEDGEEDDIKSLLSNIDESLNKSADILSAAKSSSPGLVNVELDVAALTPVSAAAPEPASASSKKSFTLGGELMRTCSISTEIETKTEKSCMEKSRDQSEISRGSEKSRGLFSNLTDLSSPTPGSSTDTRSTTKRLDSPADKSHTSQFPLQPTPPPPLLPSPPSKSPLLPSPPKSQQSPVNKMLSERSQSLRQTSFKPPSVPITSEIEEELSVADETDQDLDDFSHDEKTDNRTSSKHEVSSSRQEKSLSKEESNSSGSEASISASKTMSELKELMTEPSKRFRSSSGSTTPVQGDILSPKNVSSSDEDEKTISEKSNQDAVTRSLDSSTPRDISSEPRDVTAEPRSEAEHLPEKLVHEMLRAAVQKMLRIRQNKVQRELSSSPKYTERSPSSPEQLSPVRGEPAIFNDTYRDSELENALALARSCSTADERPTVTSPETLPTPKITVQNTAASTRSLAAAATRHLVSCIRDKRPCTLETLDLEEEYPGDFTEVERNQGRIYRDLVVNTTLECYRQIDIEYNLAARHKEELPPWKAAIKRQPRPHWMKGLPSRVNLDNIDSYLPDLVVRILGLSEECKPRKYHNMESILAQEIRDEEAEWTDYDSDELVVKFRIADAIFENLLRETMAVFSAVESKT
ncbi:hypothetical protein ACHWQZ_G016225 [Mnemiopsis leidyi]